MKGQKGITLIALIITIIVMLILVSVSITIALNTGLFTKAGSAAGKTNNAVAEENALASGDVNVNGSTMNIDSIVNAAISNTL